MKIECALAVFYIFIAAGVCAWFGAWMMVLVCLGCTLSCVVFYRAVR